MIYSSSILNKMVFKIVVRYVLRFQDPSSLTLHNCDIYHVFQNSATFFFFCCKDCYIPFLLLQRLVEKFMHATDMGTNSCNSTSSVKEQILHFRARAYMKQR